MRAWPFPFRGVQFQLCSAEDWDIIPKANTQEDSRRYIKPCKGCYGGGSELELNGLRLDVSQEYNAREGRSEGLGKDVINKQLPHCPLGQLSRQPEFLISPQNKTTDSHQVTNKQTSR